ncbi:hypothetical protein AWM68_09250 [Fictibacillus phosphorivorans]|uniref:DUF3021 domain-containing protein n=1 Tax=Fictibacillus phosphorivorans TaxID=1221500 RepID=A0A163QAU5_9BACL|nr:hypothetical protein [Fictibacillus phosphorivorans]KZE64832.1 hypothetical protein AWM68_09250 [Fictibacillus phosphorivorans]
MWKRAMAFIVDFKMMMSLFFSAGIIIYVVFGYMMGVGEISFELIVQIFFLSILVTVFQYLFWNEESTIKLSGLAKVCIQYILLGIVLLGMSQVFQWFSVGSDTFYNMLILYHVIYVGAIFGFSIYFKVLGMKFNQKMLKFKEQNQGR